MCSDGKLIRSSSGHICSVSAEQGVRTAAKEEREMKRCAVSSCRAMSNPYIPFVCYGPLHGQSRALQGKGICERKADNAADIACIYVRMIYR